MECKGFVSFSLEAESCICFASLVKKRRGELVGLLLGLGFFAL